MSDEVLGDPGFLTARERFWTAALTDERYHENRVAVAERDGVLVGIAMSGPPWTPRRRGRQLYAHGFVADGTIQVDDGVREIRMVRGVHHTR